MNYYSMRKYDIANVKDDKVTSISLLGGCVC